MIGEMERVEVVKKAVVVVIRRCCGGGGRDREREYRWEKLEIAMGECMVEVGLLSLYSLFRPSHVENNFTKEKR